MNRTQPFNLPFGPLPGHVLESATELPPWLLAKDTAGMQSPTATSKATNAAKVALSVAAVGSRMRLQADIEMHIADRPASRMLATLHLGFTLVFQ